MKFNGISLRPVTTFVAFPVFCLTTSDSQAQDRRFIPRVAGSNWHRADAANVQVMQSAAMLNKRPRS